MKNLIALLVAIVIGLALLPMIIESSDNYDIATVSETFTAIGTTAEAEILTTDETIIDVTGITVEGVALDLETDLTSATGTTVTLVNSVSDVGDTIIVTYTYQMDVSAGVDGLVSLLPILFTVILVVGVVVAIKFK